MAKGLFPDKSSPKTRRLRFFFSGMRRTGKVKEMFLCPFHEYKKPSCDVCTYRNTETRTSLGPCQIYPDATKTQGCLGKKSCYTTGLSKGNCIVVCELKEDNKSAAIMHRILAWEKGFSLSPFLFSPSPLGSNMRDMTMGCVQDTFLDAQFQIFYFTLFFCWQTKVSRRNA